MFHFTIINPPKSFVIQEKILEEIFQELKKSEKKTHSGTLNIVFVGNQKIQELNNQYRDKDAVTDVLSFHYYDDFSNLDTQDIAGEIILSEEKIIEQAKEYKLGSELEFYKLVIHSALHILGYDHENDDDYSTMNKKEEEIWNSIFSK